MTQIQKAWLGILIVWAIVLIVWAIWLLRLVAAR